MDTRPRVATSWMTGLLFLGDITCISLFSAAGVIEHASGSLLIRVPEVALPFIIGWVTVGMFTGTFSADALATPREAATRAAIAWIGANLIGQGIRATEYVNGSATPAFFLVALFVGGGLLVSWRSLASKAITYLPILS